MNEINEIINSVLKLINNQNFNEALTILNKNTKEDYRIFFLKGSIFIALNQLDLAEENLLKSLKLNNKNSSAFHNLANLYLKKKDLKSAKINYLRAIEINNNILSLNELAYLLAEENNFIEAKKLYKKALEIDNQNKKANLGIGHLYLKLNYIQKGYNHINSVNGVIRFSDKGFTIAS